MKTADENLRNDIFSKIVPSDCLVFMIKWLIRMYHGYPFCICLGRREVLLQRTKGSHPLRKVQFFLTLFKRPLTPPLSFEHYVVNFSEGKHVNAYRDNYRQNNT